MQHGLHLRTEPIKSAAQAGNTRCDPDPRSCSKLDHLRRLSRIACNRIGSAPHSTLIDARPGNSMWIEPDDVGCGSAGGSCVTASHRADTVTGSNAEDLEESSANSPPSNARRYLNTWFAFTPLTCATCETLAPGCKVNSTMRRFSDNECRLRGRRSSTTLPGSAMIHRRQMRDYAPEGITTSLRYTPKSNLINVSISITRTGPISVWASRLR